MLIIFDQKTPVWSVHDCFADICTWAFSLSHDCSKDGSDPVTVMPLEIPRK